MLLVDYKGQPGNLESFEDKDVLGWCTVCVLLHIHVHVAAQCIAPNSLLHYSKMSGVTDEEIFIPVSNVYYTKTITKWCTRTRAVCSYICILPTSNETF